MRTLLLGLNNPHHSDPQFDLYPLPKNCTGWRLWKMLNDRTGATKTEYVRVFARRNLVRDRKWSKKKARESAFQTVLFIKKSATTVIILGDDVRRAINAVLETDIQKILIHPQVVDGVAYRFVPHPSGRNLFYNDPVNRELIASLMEDLYVKARKTQS